MNSEVQIMHKYTKIERLGYLQMACVQLQNFDIY